VRRTLVGASVAWALMLPVATFAAAAARTAPGWPAVVFVVYGIGRVVCHQLPQRSFFLQAHQMPVCARCTGLYAGAAAAALAAAASGKAGSDSARQSRLLLLVAALPTVATLGYEWMTGDMPGNALRAAAGFPLGAAIAWLIVRVL
jgi:uncharacterized membrane protein